VELGFVSFGGPAGQIALMHTELVDRKRWISERRFLHALQYCMVLPGPEAQQLATYVGWLLHGTIGGLAAGALFVLPSLGILVALAWLYVLHGNLPAVQAALVGVRPAVVVVVLGAAWRIGRRALRNPVLVGLAGVSLVATLLGVPFPAIVIGMGIVGAIGGRLAPRVFVLGGGPVASAGGAAEGASHGAAMLDDDTPMPPWARFSRGRLARQGLAGVALWTAGYAAVTAIDGARGTLAALAGFFTKAALVTVGGGYAVLPYVYTGATVTHHWMDPQAVMDGLALGEATPGPLIMIVAWVGFLAGWNGPVAGWSTPGSACLGACVATFYTFLPSFLFILVGGPVVEATRAAPRLVAPLAAISAAVVGVILHLAVFFAIYAFFPPGAARRVDPVAVAIGIGAAVAVFRYEVGVVRLLLGAAAGGWIAARLH
jgi:chromate transporter